MCNRRVVIVDPNETPDYMKYWGCGLGTEIYTTDQLNGLTDDQLKVALSFGDSDAVMLVGSGGYKFFFEKTGLHAGVRSENWFDCSKLDRLSVEGGCFVKVQADFPTQDEIQCFMDPSFTQHVDFSWFQSKVIHDFQGAMKFLDWLDSLPETQDYATDVEASGMATDEIFEWSGLSICTQMFGGFISFTDIRHTATEEEYNILLRRLGDFIQKRMKHMWTYNMQYEFMVFHRMLGIDAYDMCDASVYNVLDGYHMKKYSLKWTAQRVLHATVWDTEFDWISDKISDMLFTIEGKLKKDKHRVLKVTVNTFEQTPEWAEICSRYPSYVSEFKSLMLEYFGNEFMPIPSDILGTYCNLDSFYTLMIHEARKNDYTEKARETFMDNIRLAARLHSCGMPKDEEFRSKYTDYCVEQSAFGITYSTMARCWLKMKKHGALMADINKYNPVAVKLLKDNSFFKGDPTEIAKYLLTTNVDTMDAYELGINEGQVLMKYGPNFAMKFMTLVRQSMEETEMIKTYKKTGEKILKKKIDSTIGGKKKILQVLGQKLVPLLGLDKIKINNKHIELEKYLYYERIYNELSKVSASQLNDINNMPKDVYAFGKKMSLFEYADLLASEYFKSKSPIEAEEIILDLAQTFKPETTFLAAVFNSTEQLKDNKKFYSSLGISTIDDAFSHFMTNWESVCKGVDPAQTAYPIKTYELASQFYKDQNVDQVKDMWSSFDGWQAQAQFFPNVSDQFLEYEKPFDPSDLNNVWFFHRKMTLAWCRYKKYEKIRSTYLCGLFLDTDKWVLEDPKSHVVIRECDENEPGAIKKMFARFQCMEKSSKRWSSGYHTIISHSDIKSTICSYPGHLLSYFDISSAEVKSAGFMSKDENLIDMFIKGIDVYIATAKIYLKDRWDTLSDKEKKEWRKKFKTTFLGILYGLGANSLATRLNVSKKDAEEIIEGVYQAYPKLREYVAHQQAYPLAHEGRVNTFYGDRLVVDEWRFYKTATGGEKRNLEARIGRLGCNLPIQGGTSTAMSSGFFNDLRVAKQEGWDLTSFITVHDSNTCDFPADKLWDIRKFYDKNFTDFCYDKTGIKLLFDILIGATYQDACEAKMIDDDTIELTGTARSHQMIIQKMNECPNLKYEIDMNIEDIVPKYVENSTDRMIKEQGCSFIMDKSKYTVRYHRLK